MKNSILQEGRSGEGGPIYTIQTIIDGVCTWVETFETLSEAKRWLKHACSDSDQITDRTL